MEMVILNQPESYDILVSFQTKIGVYLNVGLANYKQLAIYKGKNWGKKKCIKSENEDSQ